MSTELKDREHGTMTAFSVGCRCDECRETWNAYYRKWRADAKKRTPKVHGTVGSYQNYGCRCDLCKLASSTYHRNRRLVAQGKEPEPMPTPVPVTAEQPKVKGAPRRVGRPRKERVPPTPAKPEQFDQHTDLWAPVYNEISALCVQLIDDESSVIKPDQITDIIDLCAALQKRGVDKVPSIGVTDEGLFFAKWEGEKQSMVVQTRDNGSFMAWWLFEEEAQTTRQNDLSMSNAVYFAASRLWDFS